MLGITSFPSLTCCRSKLLSSSMTSSRSSVVIGMQVFDVFNVVAIGRVGEAPHEEINCCSASVDTAVHGLGTGGDVAGNGEVEETILDALALGLLQLAASRPAVGDADEGNEEGEDRPDSAVRLSI